MLYALSQNPRWLKGGVDEEGTRRGWLQKSKGQAGSVFQKSRDGWKEKARESKTVIKGLKNRVVFLQRSKARLQDKVTELEQELSRLKRHSGERAEEPEGVKKTPKDRPSKR